jgi:hypothetical protein
MLGGEKMKKILVLAIIALFVMVPFASFAKTAVSDSDLGAVTAQEGVTIDFAGLSLSAVSLDVQSFGDADGFASYTGAGFVGAAIQMSGNVVSLSGTMTIDVGTNATTGTAVKIGLPTVQLGSAGSNNLNITQVLKLASDKTLTTGASTLGTMYMGNLTATISGGLVVRAH